jgi:predicted esterase
VEGVNIALVYRDARDRLKQTTASFKLNFCHRSVQDPHKVTFLHPSGTVSYAILRPPTSKAKTPAFPILLNLHGAGLEADNYQVRHMLDAVPDLNAWVLFPNGMSPWSGDDWHVWGFADVKAAVSAIPDWISNTDWAGPRADTENWVVTGHSNGGQGSWFISAHQPDKVFAAAAVSGYSSIQNYVPYIMWREASPLLNSIIQNSLSSYRHELLLENMTGKPLYQQHGAKDSNVPPYHSRLLSSLLHKSGCSSQYVELPKQRHWFDGAMATTSLRAFYSSVLDTGAPTTKFPEKFEFAVPNSGDVGSRAGIFIDQLQSPDVFGKLSVHRNDRDHVWNITTSNVRRMHFHFQASEVQRPKTISLDGVLICIPSKSREADGVAVVNCDGEWAMCNNCDWKVSSARYGRQRGSLDAILRTSSHFKISLCSDGAFGEGLQISQNLMQYYGADAEITVSGECSEVAEPGNVISLTIGKAISPALMDNFPVQIGAGGVEIRRPPPSVVRRIRNQPGLGSAFLRPLPDENLELVLWGSDQVGLRQAMRMVPTLTGAGQPDFIVLGNDARWQGHAGVLAMGFFDHAWQISQASYIP